MWTFENDPAFKYEKAVYCPWCGGYWLEVVQEIHSNKYEGHVIVYQCRCGCKFKAMIPEDKAGWTEAMVVRVGRKWDKSWVALDKGE